MANGELWGEVLAGGDLYLAGTAAGLPLRLLSLSGLYGGDGIQEAGRSLLRSQELRRW